MNPSVPSSSSSPLRLYIVVLNVKYVRVWVCVIIISSVIVVYISCCCYYCILLKFLLSIWYLSHYWLNYARPFFFYFSLLASMKDREQKTGKEFKRDFFFFLLSNKRRFLLIKSKRFPTVIKYFMTQN